MDPIPGGQVGGGLCLVPGCCGVNPCGGCNCDSRYTSDCGGLWVNCDFGDGCPGSCITCRCY